MDPLIFASLASIVTVVRRIRISRRRVRQFLFIVFLTLFFFILFHAFIFAVFDIISQIRSVLASLIAAIAIIWLIRFSRRRVLRWWVWLWVRWYVQLSCSLWRFRWSCLWHGFWSFCSNSYRVHLWRCYIGRVCTDRSWVQKWSNHWNVLAPKVQIFPPYFKISFIAIVLFWPCCAH